MKRIFLFITALLLTTLTISAQQISKEAALRKATTFVNKDNKMLKQFPTLAYKAEKPANAIMANPDEAYFYVFNRGFNQGFVIVSGDERTNDILGYCDHGTFDPDNLPPSFKYFLEEYANQIKYIQENNIQPEPAKAAAAKTDVDYLIKATWNQGDPYNYYLNGCATGCVATAIAQVMYYWQWPEDATVTIPAYSGSGNVTSTTLEPTTFDWSKMKKSYRTGDYDDDHEVAKLMKYVGHSVEMNYGTESGALPKDIKPALITYFGYPNDIQYIGRAGLTATEWADTIYANLSNDMPVIMGGYNSDGGHCFICDGYRASDGKYHINWGWGGSSDGYFDLEVLAPSSMGTGASGSDGFTSNRSIVARIHNPSHIVPAIPEDSIPLTATYMRLMAGNQVLTRDSRSDYVSGDLRYDSYVATNITDSAQVDTLITGMGIYDEDDNLINVVNARYSTFNINGGYYNSDISSFGAEYPYGSYKIYPVWGDVIAGRWRKINGTGSLYIQADVDEDGTKVTFTPSRSITVVVNETSSGSGSNKKYTQTMTVTNTGKEIFSGELVIWVAGVGYSIGYDVTDLAVGDSKTYTITDYIGTISDDGTQIENTGKYSISQLLLLVGFDAYLTDALWENISSSSSYGDIVGLYNFWTESEWTGRTYHLGNNVKFSAEFVNYGCKAASQTVTATLTPKGSTSGNTSQQSLTIDAFSKKAVEFDFSKVSKYDTEYDLTIQYSSLGRATADTLSVYGYVITPVKGIIVEGASSSQMLLDNDASSWSTIPDDAYYVDARKSDQASSIVPNNNPNTVYLLAEGSSVPTNLEGKNVVIGTTCDELNIDDNYEFYTPIDFTATKANYKRTFVNGNDGSTGNWETLVLPFDVSKVTKDDGATTLKWFTDKSQYGKNFWIYRFASEDDDNTVVFNCPESATLLPGETPYIITVPAQSTKWSDKWVLTGKELTFTGENVSISASYKFTTSMGADKKFDFIGRTYAAERNQIYYLNEAGSRFENTHSAWAELNPFRCYFVGYFNNETLTINMRIGDNNTTPTGIEETLADTDAPTAAAPMVYSLDGKALGTDVKQLPLGTYISGGKKFMVKGYNRQMPQLKLK